jgi:hypothetical protein
MTWTVKERRSLSKRVRKLPEKEIKLIEVIYAGTHEKAPY